MYLPVPLLLYGPSGCVGQCCIDVGVPTAPQGREELMPQAIAREGRVGVAGVLAPRDSPRTKVAQHLASRHVDHRSHQPSLQRRPDPAQPAATGTAEQAKEHGLGLIGSGMSRGDRGTCACGDELAEEPIPAMASGRLDVAIAQRGDTSHVLGSNNALAAELLGRGSNKSLVRVGLATAKLVVQVNRAELAAGKQLSQRVQEGDGVRAAGHGDPDPPGSFEQAVPVNPLGDFRQHIPNVYGTRFPFAGSGQARSRRRCASPVVSLAFPPYALRGMALVAILALLLAPASAAKDLEACGSVPVYDPCEIRVEVPGTELSSHSNPYASVTLRAEFRSPKGGRTKVMPAFWNGGNQFTLRFSPDFEGRWDYRLISNIESLDKRTGSFQAVEARTPGFIQVFNSRYFKYPLTNTPHFWLGTTMLAAGNASWESFKAFADKRSEQGFTHMRVSVLGPPGNAKRAFEAPEAPWIEYFAELDRRIAYLHGLGFVTDLVLANSGGELESLFPRIRQRDRYVRYVCARYSAFSVTWQGLLEWESHASGSKLLKQLAASLDKHDPYSHPKSTGATVSSAPLAHEGWQDYFIQNRVDPALASIEFEMQRAPFVNTGVGLGASPDAARRQAWTAASRGHYVTLSEASADPESELAAQMERLVQFFSQSRYFDLQPHYRVVGGAALALQRVPRWAEEAIGIEYIVYAEQPGLIELVMPKHEYSVSWYDPSDGSWHDQKKKFKGDRYRSRTPSDDRDWVLYLRREGKKKGYNKSFILESKTPRFREVEHLQAELPFDIQLPSANEIRVGQEHDFNATLRKNTIAAKRMVWLWTGEVAGAGRGTRVLGTTQSGRFTVPAELVGSYPATLSVRLVGLDGAGRLFEAFRPYSLLPPE